MAQDPDFSYRTTPTLVQSNAPVFTQDDADESTLRSVYKDLKKVMDEIDAWHAFDLSKDSPLTVEQQIVAHAKAYDMVEPALSAVTNALALTDEKFRERNPNGAE